MKPDTDDVGTDLAPLAGVAAGAEIFHVDAVLDHQGGPKRAIGCLNDAAEERRFPKRAEHLALGQISPRALHGFPPGSVAEQTFCEFDRHRD
jgi:hypothetical protein